MNSTSALGFSLLNYKGVIHWIGLPISMDSCFSTMSVVDFPGVDSGFSSPFLTRPHSEI
jgi:hypothetical protein